MEKYGELRQPLEGSDLDELSRAVRAALSLVEEVKTDPGLSIGQLLVLHFIYHMTSSKRSRKAVGNGKGYSVKTAKTL